jgi:hypothetical protein
VKYVPDADAGIVKSDFDLVSGLRAENWLE